MLNTFFVYKKMSDILISNQFVAFMEVYLHNKYIIIV